MRRVAFLGACLFAASQVFGAVGADSFVDVPVPQSKSVSPLEESRARVKEMLVDCGDGQRCLPGGFRLGAPIYIHIWKNREKEMSDPHIQLNVGQLELWMEKDGGFQLYKIFPICRYHAIGTDAGPRQSGTDGRAPEGIYTVGPAQLNPGSKYYLSFDIGYPNAEDRKAGRKGQHIMVHGDCASAGCFAMGHDQDGNQRVGEIYVIAEAALKGGQKKFIVEIVP